MFDPVEAIKELVSHPSVSTDGRYAEGMKGTRKVMRSLFESIGLEVEEVETPRHPVLLARRKGPDDWPHVVIYGHYDVQPPDPLDRWQTKPFEPTIIGTRLHGRGAADNKGTLMIHIAAVGELLEENPDLPLRLTFIVEGEEEISSPNLPKVLEKHKDELSGDFLLVSDTVIPSKDQIAITTGLRGMVSMEATVTGPDRDLHSGLFGGAILNPLQALTEICASLHNQDGTVNVPGFYDEVIAPEDWEMEEVAKLGFDDASFCKMVGIEKTYTAHGRTAAEAVRYEPTLEFNGIGGGYQGEGEKTIIPSRAFVKITCRLVARQDPEDIREKVARTLRKRCPGQVKLDISFGHIGLPYSIVPPGRPNTPDKQNPYLAKAFQAVDAAVIQHFGIPPLYLREGGSIPIIGTMKQILGTDALLLGMFTPQDNLHAPNESWDLSLLPKGIAVSKSILNQVARGGS